MPSYDVDLLIRLEPQRLRSSSFSELMLRSEACCWGKRLLKEATTAYVCRRCQYCKTSA